MKTYLKNLTLQTLKENYPNTNQEVLESFLDSVERMSNYPPDLTQKYLRGVHSKYPKEMLDDKKYFSVIAGVEYFHGGYAEADTLMHMHQMSDFIEPTAAKESAIIDRMEKMSDFYKEIMQDCIYEFKRENQVFKDVRIPLPKSSILPQKKDVTHNGEAAACIREHTVQATNFRFMKEWYGQKPNYFVITHRIDQADDIASYKFRSLNTNNFEKASNMFEDIVASRGFTNDNLLESLSNLPSKDLKQILERSMSEFKAQQRDYYAKWEEWRSTKEEWIDCAMEEDNLSQRAEWSVEACQKQLVKVVQNALISHIENAEKNYSHKEIYAAIQPGLDMRGYKLYDHALYLGEELEDNLNFKEPNGFGGLRFFEAVNFGECKYVENYGHVNMSEYHIDADTERFQEYQNKLFGHVISYFKSPDASSTMYIEGVARCLTAISGLQNISDMKINPQISPDDGWINAYEHCEKYCINHEEDDKFYSLAKNNYRVDANYRLYETFHQPDDKVPDAPQLESPSGGVPSNKLLNLMMPNRETPRLQSELKLIINNTSVMRDYVGSLDKSILEMKSEISQMREHNAQAGHEIASGKHFKDWLRLNLSAETKALGLDPEKATFQDLMKTLSQNVPEPQRAQEIVMEME